MTTELTPAELDELRALCDAATKGPWERDDIDVSTYVYARCVGGCQMRVDRFPVLQIRGWGHLSYLGEQKAIEIQNANRDFATSARTAMPRLIDEVRRLNEWADSFSDAQLKERATCEALITERDDDNAKLRAALEMWRAIYPCGPLTEAAEEDDQVWEAFTTAIRATEEAIGR